MQDPVRELPGLINQLLQAPAHKQRQLIERYFTPDCRLTHAIVLGRDREDIVRISQAWRFVNVHLSADVQDIFLSREGDRVFVQLVQHVTYYLHGPVGFDLGMASVLYLRDSPQGALIYKQVDLHQFESILYHWPLVGPLLEVFLRRVLSWQMTRGAALMAWGWGKVEGWLESKGVSAGEGGPLGWAKATLSALWWREGHSRQGRLTVPYSMQ